jgi:transcriptional regulator of nitric oxide reductase
MLAKASLCASAADLALEEIRSVFPAVDRSGPMAGSPPAVPVYRDGQLAGYVFYSNGAVKSAGYTGKPVNILVGLGLDGIITGARLIEHHEPILAIGVHEDMLRRFIESHRGVHITRSPVSVGRRREGKQNIDAISGATVSSLVMNDAIVRSARAVARSRGFFGVAPSGGIDPDLFEPATWAQLLADGSIVHRRVERKPAIGADAPLLLLDLFVALANPPRIGRNLLGDKLYLSAMADIQPQDAVLLIAGNGLYSFKGTAFVRTGEFDRIRLVQDGRAFSLRSEHHRRVDALPAPEAPEFREIGLFILPRATGFEILKPWTLEVRLPPPPDQASDPPVVELSYRLPGSYLRSVLSSPVEASSTGVRSPRSAAAERGVPDGLAEAVQIGLVGLAALAAALLAVLAFLQRRRR